MGGGERAFPRGRLIPGLPKGDDATTGFIGSMVDKMGGGERAFPRGRLIPGLPKGDDATTGLYRRYIYKKVNSACPT